MKQNTKIILKLFQNNFISHVTTAKVQKISEMFKVFLSFMHHSCSKFTKKCKEKYTVYAGYPTQDPLHAPRSLYQKVNCPLGK